MGVEILVPLGAFVMVILIVLISVMGATQARKATLNTVEEAIRAGQQVTPEMVRALGMPRKNGGSQRGGDLKAGAILLAVAVSLIVMGWMFGGVDGDAEAVRIMTGIAALPGLIGLVLIIFGIFNRNKDAE